MASPLDSGIGVHNSRDHRSLILPFIGDEWRTFLNGVGDREFDSFDLANDSTPGWMVEIAKHECVRPVFHTVRVDRRLDALWEADVTNEPPRSVKASGAGDRPPARTRRRPADRIDHVATNGADHAGEEGSATQEKDCAPKRTTIRRRWFCDPKNRQARQLDFDDRHDTRSTHSDEMAQRYAELRKDRRRSDWHNLAMSLTAFIVGVTVYLTGFVVVSRQLPHLSPRLIAQIVGLAAVAAGGGVAFRLATLALKRRHTRQRGSPKSD